MIKNFISLNSFSILLKAFSTSLVALTVLPPDSLYISIAIDVSLHGCDEDAKKHCDGLEANSNQVFMCLLAYEDHLSEQCKQGILEVAMTMKIAEAAIGYSVGACEADADKLCLDVEPGEGRIVGCIKANESKVSKECISALKETGLWEIGQ